LNDQTRRTYESQRRAEAFLKQVDEVVRERVDAAGRIAYAGQQGPWGFKPDKIERWLKTHIGPPKR